MKDKKQKQAKEAERILQEVGEFIDSEEFVEEYTKRAINLALTSGIKLGEENILNQLEGWFETQEILRDKKLMKELKKSSKANHSQRKELPKNWGSSTKKQFGLDTPPSDTHNKAEMAIPPNPKGIGYPCHIYMKSQKIITALKEKIEEIEIEIPIVKNPKFKLYDVKKGLTIPSVYFIEVVRYFQLKASLKTAKEILKARDNEVENKVNQIVKENGGELATWLHNSYESISKQVNWKTQKDCQVEFDNLPKENQSVMLRLAQKIQVEKIIPLLLQIQELKAKLKGVDK